MWECHEGSSWGVYLIVPEGGCLIREVFGGGLGKLPMKGNREFLEVTSKVSQDSTFEICCSVCKPIARSLTRLEW